MVRAGSLPGGQRPAPTGVWFLPPVLVAACAVIAVLVVPAAARAPVVWCGMAATAAVGIAAGEIMRRGRAMSALHRRLERQTGETARLACDVLPVVVGKIQEGAPPEQLMPRDLDPPDIDPRLAASHRTLLRTLVHIIQTKELQRDSAKQAIVNIACRIQAELHRLQADMRRMQFKHGHNPDAMGDFMHLEHGINVTGRVATSLAVLGGGGPARTWQKPVSLYDVLRAGCAPIADYKRVERHRCVEVAVVGPAVEPLSVVLAELLDNATRYSPPNTSVIMNAEDVASGVEISIEDKGTGLTAESRRYAEFLLTQGVDGVDLDELGETARMGLRVAGILARQHNLKISLRPSSCNGVRALVFVPHEWLTPLPMPPVYPGMKIKPPLPSPPVVANARREVRDERYEPRETADDVERNASGLPQRRRRPVTDGRPPRAGGPAAAGPGDASRPATEPGLWVAEFFGVAETDEAPSAASDRPAGNEQ